MAVRTRPISVEEYNMILDKMCSTFTYKIINKNNEEEERLFRASHKVAFALELQANLGLRIGDILDLTLDSFIADGKGGYKIYIKEGKTGKIKDVEIDTAIYKEIKIYALESGIKDNEKLVNMSVRNIQIQLKTVCDVLDLKNVSTHSFRKFYAMRIFESTGYNFEVVRALLNHSNVGVTQKYLGVSNEEISKASKGHNFMRSNLK